MPILNFSNFSNFCAGDIISRVGDIPYILTSIQALFVTALNMKLKIVFRDYVESYGKETLCNLLYYLYEQLAF